MPSDREANLSPRDPGDLLLESWIASAKDYVVPSEDFRPRVLEAARQVSAGKLQERRIGKALLASSLVFWGWMMVWPFLDSIQASQVANSGDRIERRALELFDSQSMDIQSATQQAYSEWRQSLVSNPESGFSSSVK